uniref:Putative secreted protein n=1 Tax=Ixodes ricinus TaxID=34613 RepID=A0A147BFB7_IXORI
MSARLLAPIFSLLLSLPEPSSSMLLNAVFTWTSTRQSDTCQADPSSRTIADRAMCPFNMTVDFDPSRFPHSIPTATCRCPETYCSSTGPHVCTQVKRDMQVFYKRDGALVPAVVSMPTACVCAMPYSVAAHGWGRRVIHDKVVSRSHNVHVQNALNGIVVV